MGLPKTGPWPHTYYETPGARIAVRFEDAQGKAHAVDTHYKHAGSGQPIVLVHGLMTSSYSWRYVIAELAKHYRVIAPDLVGSGQSEKPLDLVYSVANVARFIAAFVKATCEEEPYLVGNSLGGLYTLRAVLDAPCARRYVLVHAPGFPYYRTRLLHGLLDGPWRGPLERGGARLLHRARRFLVRHGVHYHRKDVLSQEEVAEYSRPFEDVRGARAFVKILRESLDPDEHARIIAELRDRRERGVPLRCPTLLLYSKEDVMVPPEFGPRYAAELPGAKLEVLEDTSHFVQVDAPERTVQRILAFDGR